MLKKSEIENFLDVKKKAIEAQQPIIEEINNKLEILVSICYPDEKREDWEWKVVEDYKMPRPDPKPLEILKINSQQRIGPIVVSRDLIDGLNDIFNWSFALEELFMDDSAFREKYEKKYNNLDKFKWKR